MTDMVKIDNNTDLARDLKSFAVINTNTNARDKYLAERAKRVKTQQELDNVKQEMADIKQLLTKILNK
jgi:hypothetical protein